MSRVGNQAITLPAGVSVEVSGEQVTTKGPKGTLTAPLMPGITVKNEEGVLTVARANDQKETRAFHGLCRSLINNTVLGVTEGFAKELEIHGVGYRAAVKGKEVEFALGYSHPINFPIPEGITVTVEKNTQIKVEGIDKQQVGQVAANMRKLRKPEPYKGKGIRYKGEYILRKVGKAAG